MLPVNAKVVLEVQMLKRIKYKNVKPIYKIDQDGNIYSEYKKNYMQPRKDKDGYYKLALRTKKGDFLYVRVATLVAYEFLGKPPKNMKDPTVDHIDGNKTNNFYKNLRWLERTENSKIRKNNCEGELNAMSKLKEKEVKEICELLMKNVLTCKEIAQKYGVDKSAISNIKMKKNWLKITKEYDFSILKLERDEKGRYCKRKGI